MTDSELHPYVELIAREARRPVAFDQAARDRVMAAVRAEPIPRRLGFWQRALEPRSFQFSPIGGALLAAGLVGVGVITSEFAINRDGRPAGQDPLVAHEGLPVSHKSDTVFVFVAPKAAAVSLVGDFNDWDATKAPLVRASGGLWTITLPLSAGRHEYQFVVDGTWLPDPGAPVAGDDGFGRTNSVRIVRKGSAL
jgi:hypothetical protein